jgi:hypothetical protein
MIELLRYQQRREQAQAISLSRQQQMPTAQYLGRDQNTGQRLIGFADGSKFAANYLGTNEPQPAPFYSPNALGLPGFSQNR